MYKWAAVLPWYFYQSLQSKLILNIVNSQKNPFYFFLYKAIVFICDIVQKMACFDSTDARSLCLLFC